MLRTQLRTFNNAPCEGAVTSGSWGSFIMPVLNRSHIAKALKDKSDITPTQLKHLGLKTKPIDWIDKVLGKSYTLEQISGFIGTTSPSPRNRRYKKTKIKKKKSSRKKHTPKKPPKPTRKEIYDEQLKSKEWIELRDRIVMRDNNRCIQCGEKSKVLHVHHLLYEKGKAIWNVPDYYLVTLCPGCHKKEHSRVLTPPTKHF